MAIMQMQRVSICALKTDREAILKRLQAMGIMEMNVESVQEDGFASESTLEEQQELLRKAQIMEQALDVLESYAPEKKSIFASLEGKTEIGTAQLQAIVGQKEHLLKKAELLTTRNKEAAEKKAAILKIENQIESLEPWMGLHVPLNFPGTKKTSTFFGTMSAGTTEEMIYELLADRASEAVDVEIVASEKDGVYLAVFCMKEQKRLVEDALRSGGFVKPVYVSGQTPAEEKADLIKEKQKLQEEIDRIQGEIKAGAAFRQGFQILSDSYRLAAGQSEAAGILPQSKETFVVSGYVAKKYVPVIEQGIGQAFACVVDVEELKEEEEAPVLLKNHHVAEALEGITASYGLPNRHEFDPTAIMSFFYIFFFGMMLSDAGYGAILAVVCFVLLKKFPRMEKSMKKTLSMFMYCGISTVVWGVLFGGYFGNIVDIVSTTYFGKTITIKPLWFAPLDEPTKLLLYSLGFGIIHLLIGLGLKGYLLLREHRVLDFFCDIVLWYLLLIGLLLMLIPSSIFTSIAQQQVVFPEALNAAAKWMTIAGLVGIILMSGRNNKNPVLRFLLGLYDVYNITSWLSDVLSYSRLLALGLATGVIAQVVNQMGSLAGKSIFGVLVFIVVFLVGHGMSLAINLLGAYVHTNRLQYVEFFGKFYEGGGKPFEPFEADTKYVEIKEEM